jgi:hypothetical protein
MLARIRLDDVAAADELARALTAADCVAVAQAGSVAVLAVGSDADERQAAWLDLSFFLKAWAADHPTVVVRLS